MTTFKKLWKTKKTRIFMIVCPIVLIFVLVISLVITLNPLISGTFDILFGKDKAITGEGNGIYKADYATKAEATEAAEDFGVEVLKEGITLLKNDDDALPLQSAKRNVTVFGKNSVNLVYGGSGSSASRSDSNKTIYDSLTDAGFNVNPTMKAFYEDSSKSGSGRDSAPAMGSILAGMKIGETPISSYNGTVRQSYSSYKDAAIVVISRSGGEGYDLPRTMKKSFDSIDKVDGARNADDHYLQLDQNETDMLEEACSNFDEVIVVLNTAQVMETGFLDDPTHYAYHDNIKACLWMGLPATKGVMALGKILTGEVNPSGHTVDTYVRNFKEDPTWQNFGNNLTDKGNEYLVDGVGQDFYYVQYEEGIYSGYRYYETRYHDLGDDGESWYKNHVVYPFGYGLSYTTFSWDVTFGDKTSISSASDEIKVNVKVKNTGNYAGKDVVQLYYTAPYSAGGIEKSYVTLGDFAKTSLLEPGAEETLELSLKAEDMKSYDYKGLNDSSYKGYILEKGNYELHVAHNSHEFEDSHTYTLAEDIRIENDTTTGTKVENQFDDMSEGLSVMQRSDMDNTFPTTPTTSDRTVSASDIPSIKYTKSDEGKPWYVEEDKKPTQATSVVSEPTVTLKDVIGLDYNDKKWDELLNQLTIDQMSELIGKGAYGSIAIQNIGKPLTNEPDGPSGFTSFMSVGDTASVYGCAFYPAETVLASTWNVELAKEMGVHVGNEGLIGNEKGDKLPYAGWYAPAVNVHRSPFGGRNWEYYSEDSLLSGKMGAEVVKGCKEKGVYCFVKHFAGNEQETNRDSNGCMSWIDEQTFREIYLKPFEIIVKEGKTTAMMSSFNRLGKTWAGGSYALLTSVLRKEWGFVGEVVTDYNLLRYMSTEQMIRAGGDLVLNQEGKNPKTDDTSATQVTCIRNAAHNILYTVANSCAMNVDIIGYSMSNWKIMTIVIDCVILAGMAIWGGIVITLTLRKKEDLIAE